MDGRDHSEDIVSLISAFFGQSIIHAGKFENAFPKLASNRDIRAEIDEFGNRPIWTFWIFYDNTVDP